MPRTAEIQAISQRLFHGPSSPGIFLTDESQLAASLAPRLAPDVAMVPPSPQIGVVHRHTDSAEIYFIANTSNRPATTTATFRVEGLRPQVWNAITGEATSAAIVDRPPGGTSIKLTLEPYESTIIVWVANKMPAAAPVTAATPIDLSTDWTVQFGNDSNPKPMQALRSWTDDPATRDFSGVCTYTRHFTLPADTLEKNSHLSLTFGSGVPHVGERSGSGFQADLDPPIRDAAIIFINGHRAGSLWCPPYQLDVTRWLTPGDNMVRIDVANTAVNALAAHGFPNYDVRAITREFGNRFNPPDARLFQPIPSGLLGPIQLH